MKNETDDLDLPRFANDGFSPAPVGTITGEGLTDGDSLMDGDNASFRWFSSNVLCQLSPSSICTDIDLAIWNI